MIWAKADDVLFHVRAVVRSSEWAYVRRFSVGTRRGVEPHSADLAPKFVQFLNLSRLLCIPDNPLDRCWRAGWRLNLDRRFWLPRRQRARIDLSESITPHFEARTSGLLPKVIHSVQAVIPIPGSGCIGRVEICSSCNSYRKPIDLAFRESLVAEGELLIFDLAAGVGIPSSVTCVDDFIASVFVVLVTSRKDD